MYGWSVWVTARILVELPWSVLSGMPMFSCWYWTVGFPTERAGFTFIVVAGFGAALCHDDWTGECGRGTDGRDRCVGVHQYVLVSLDVVSASFHHFLVFSGY